MIQLLLLAERNPPDNLSTVNRMPQEPIPLMTQIIFEVFNLLLPVSNKTFAAEAVGRLETEKAAIHAEYEQVRIIRTLCWDVE